MIAAHGTPERTDDHSDTTATATALGAQATYALDGVIGTPATRTSSPSTTTARTDLTATATGIGDGASLDIKLDVLDSGGAVLSSDDPASGQDTSSWPAHATGTDAARHRARAGRHLLRARRRRRARQPGDHRLLRLRQHRPVPPGHHRLLRRLRPATLSTDIGDRRRDTAHHHGTVTWSAPTSSGDTPVSGYRVSGIPGGPQVVGASARSLQVSGFDPGTTYPVTVYALNDQGSSPGGDASLRIDTWAPTTAPGLNLTPGTNRLQVGWSVPANPGRATLTGWRLQLLSGSTVRYDNPAVAPGTRAATFTNLAAGSYQVRVTPVVTADDPTPPVTAGSTAAVRAPAISRPSAPGIRVASSGRRGRPITAVVRWFAPANKGGAPVVAYRVRALKLRRNGRVGRVLTTRWLGARTRAINLRLPRGRYRFVVIAVNRAGPSPWSHRSNRVRAR